MDMTLTRLKSNIGTGFILKCLISLALVLGLLTLARNTRGTRVSSEMVESNSSISVQQTALSDGEMFKFFRKDEKLSYKDGLKLMKESKEFRTLIVDTISIAQQQAVFWEFPPLSKKTDPSFEFIVNNARSLSRVSVDKTTFQSYFKPDCTVTTFPNLGGDATLIAPCLISDKANNAHLASFLRSAPHDQIHELLRTVAQEVERWLENSDNTVWLSTSGAGVYYLHVRLDSNPKYYTYSPYRNAKYSTD